MGWGGIKILYPLSRQVDCYALMNSLMNSIATGAVAFEEGITTPRRARTQGFLGRIFDTSAPMRFFLDSASILQAPIDWVNLPTSRNAWRPPASTPHMETKPWIIPGYRETMVGTPAFWRRIA